MKTKLISVLLALSLSLGAFSVPAYAYVEGDANAEAAEDAAITAVDGSAEDTAATGDESGTLSTDTLTELEKTLEESAVATGTVVGVDSYLNLRSGAGTGYEVIGHLLPGTTVEILDEENGWYQVTTPEQTGYVSGNYLEVLEDSSEGGMDEALLLMMLGLMMQSGTDSTIPALTPDGNLTLVDDLTEDGKQFITVVTKSGNYFYLIIDRDDEGESTVHFLNQVDEADLLSLMDEDAVAEYEASSVDPENNPTESDVPNEADAPDASVTEPEPAVEPDTDEDSGKNLLPVLALLIVLAAVSGFFAYTKVKGKKKKETRLDPDADYDGEDEDEYEYDLPEDEALEEPVDELGDDEPV